MQATRTSVWKCGKRKINYYKANPIFFFNIVSLLDITTSFIVPVYYYYSFNYEIYVFSFYSPLYYCHSHPKRGL